MLKIHDRAMRPRMSEDAISSARQAVKPAITATNGNNVSYSAAVTINYCTYALSAASLYYGDLLESLEKDRDMPGSQRVTCVWQRCHDYPSHHRFSGVVCAM